MSVIHTPRKPDLDLRLLAFPAAMLGLLTIIFFRFWYFQVVMAPVLAERAGESRHDTVTQQAPRGLIYDRNGVLLAGIRPQIAVTGIYSIIKKNPGVLDKVAGMLGVETRKLRLAEARQSPGMAVPIFVGVGPEVGTRIAEAAAQLPGIGVELSPMRFYPDSQSFTDVLGYVRLPNQADLRLIRAKGKEPAAYVGKAGIERSYELDLMGASGDETMEVDAKRTPLRVVGRDNPVPGNELVLSLDARLQKMAAQIMHEHGYKGAVVAIVPKTGEVLTMVSSPSYDQSLFEHGMSTDEWQKLINDPDHPLTKRAFQSAYAPGSTFKLVTSIAAYESGQWDPNREVVCDGGYKLGRRVLKCMGHHGPISYVRALEKSCNTYFADLGFRCGPDALRHAAEEVGLGGSTGIDIGGQSLGIVPTEAWLAKHYKHPHWYGGDTINMAVGQGQVSVTPLQMCNVAALVANEGVSYKPHLVKEIKSSIDPNQVQRVDPEVLHQVNASHVFWSTLKSAMEGVISTDGTAGAAKIPNLIWAGKTGSSEHGTGLKTHSWFVGYAPADDPKIAIAVLVEQSGEGGEIAAPIAGEIVQSYLFPPKAPAKSATAASMASASARSPKAE